ncbi:MAG: prepilin peptidase [bacterium]
MDADAALWLLSLVPLLFVVALGCCVGSLINVLVYRMPLGLGVVTPASRCPMCQTRLTWRENIPVLGWLLLGGRCRFCRCRISGAYPAVELCVGVLFGVVWVVCYMLPNGTTVLGMPVYMLTPDWAMNTWQYTWPIYGVIVGLLSCLLAMTIIDAKTFMIPLALPWTAALIGLIGHVGCVFYLHLLGRPMLMTTAGDMGGTKWWWAIATPTPSMELFGGWWWWIGASIGAVVGLGVGLLLLRAGVIGRSFAGYEAWEKEQLEKQAVAGPHQPGNDDPTALWTAYPHARREMVKECAFLAPAGVLGALGGWLFVRIWGGSGIGSVEGSITMDGAVPPLWLIVLAGVLMGYLIGGGLVWGVRILGTLAFGKEAMGMGDVHLMAGVGACLGWIDSTVAFFLSAFIAMGWTLLTLVGGSRLRRTMPYGPWLALASALVFLFKPGVEWGISHLIGSPVPINLP